MGLVNNVTYSPATHPEWFLELVKSAKTVASGKLQILPNAVKDIKVKRLSLTGSVSQVDDLDCGWSDSDALTADTKTISVKPFKVNFSVCKDSLDSIKSLQAFSGQMPADLSDAIFSQLSKGLALDLEKILWGGTGNEVDTYKNGIVDKALVDNDVTKVDGATLTAANIIAEIDKLYNATSDEVIASENVVLYMNTGALRFLKQALSSKDSNVLLPSYTIEGENMFYLGMPIQESGLPANTMVIAPWDNIALACDILANTTELVGEQGTGKDYKNYFIHGDYKAAGDYIMPSEIFLYRIKPANP